MFHQTTAEYFENHVYLDRLTSHKRNYTTYTKVILLPSKLQKFGVLWILCKTHVILNDLLCIIMVLRNLQNPIYSFRIQDLNTVICGYSDTFLTGLNCSRT